MLLQQVWQEENAPRPVIANGQVDSPAQEVGETSEVNQGNAEEESKQDGNQVEVLKQGQEDGDVDIEAEDAKTEQQEENEGDDEPMMVIDDINNVSNVGVEDEGQDTSEPLEADVASDDDEEEEDEETSRATRRGRVTRAGTGTKSAKTGKKRGRKV